MPSRASIIPSFSATSHQPPDQRPRSCRLAPSAGAAVSPTDFWPSRDHRVSGRLDLPEAASGDGPPSCSLLLPGTPAVPRPSACLRTSLAAPRCIPIPSLPPTPLPLPPYSVAKAAVGAQVSRHPWGSRIAGWRAVLRTPPRLPPLPASCQYHLVSAKPCRTSRLAGVAPFPPMIRDSAPRPDDQSKPSILLYFLEP